MADMNHFLTYSEELSSGKRETAVTMAEEGLYAAAYSGIQSPIQSLAQVVDHTTGTNLEPRVSLMKAPEAHRFGSPNWHAQQIGTAGGMIAPFLLVHAGTRGAFSKCGLSSKVAPGTTRALWSKANGVAVAECTVSGFVYDAALRPVADQEGPFWSARLKHGITGAATFGTLAAAGIGLKHTLNPLSRWQNAMTGGVAGVPAGLVSGETSSLLTHGRHANLEELGTSAYTMGVIGGAFGALHRSQARPGQQRKAESATEPVAERTDRPAETRRVERILPEESLSMRELAESGDLAKLDKLLDEYHPELEKAFPLEGEIEGRETYREYLTEPGTWDMVLLRDKDHKILGGIQYQVVDVGGKNISKAAWAEHIWVKQENRNYDNFRALLKVARDRVEAENADLVFMEFNNPKKMTPQEIAIDAEGGITTQDRAKIWGRVGIHVAVDSKGNIAPYAQPGMLGEGGVPQPPVKYLSLGFVGAEPLTGKSISAADYLALVRAAHKTIPGVDLALDPTVLEYTRQLTEMAEPTLCLRPLSEVMKSELASGRQKKSAR